MVKKFKILSKIDWDILNEYVNNDLIIINKHPDYDLWILNYSPKVQYKQLWDDYTISCRGLIINENGDILARPFQKFKNWEEYSIDDIPQNENFEVFEKIDGSLIILFYYPLYNEWIIASRGSFISDQAKEAEKFINKKIFKHLNKNYTFLFEIIYPENRIVVDYGNKKDLILLTSIKTKDGKELSYDDLYSKYSKYFSIVKKMNFKTIDDILEYIKLDKDNEEGVVVRFENGFRVKIKFSEYVRLHAIMTNVSNLTIWEYMKNGYDFNELIDRIPDEFYNWINNVKNKLQNEFNEIERKSLKEFLRIYHINGIINRKLFAEEAKKFKYPSILFKIYDKRAYDLIIWKIIKPKYIKPFSDGFKLTN